MHVKRWSLEYYFFPCQQTKKIFSRLENKADVNVNPGFLRKQRVFFKKLTWKNLISNKAHQKTHSTFPLKKLFIRKGTCPLNLRASLLDMVVLWLLIWCFFLFMFCNLAECKKNIRKQCVYRYQHFFVICARTEKILGQGLCRNRKLGCIPLPVPIKNNEFCNQWLIQWYRPIYFKVNMLYC